MNLSQLEVLIAIVDTGSLTEAAEEVGLTQSAVSYSLSRLEKELGVTLLERGRQGITVSGIGEEVLQHARQIMAQVEIIRQKTSRERGLSIGKLRLGHTPNMAPRLLAGIMRSFQHKYPEIEMVLFEGHPKELVDWLANGIIDVGTVLAPEDYEFTVKLAHSELKIVVSTNHPLAAQTHVSSEKLAHELFIGPKTEYRILSDMLRLQNTIVPRIQYEASTIDTIVAMVRENMGISLIPDMLIKPGIEGVTVLSVVPSLYIDIYLATNVRSPVAETFLANAHLWAENHGFLPELA